MSDQTQEILTWADFLVVNPDFAPEFHGAWSQIQPLLISTAINDDSCGALLWRCLFASFIDCNDILNLSSHDGHWGALKLLRSLYERTVTAKYIEQNPEKADDFFGFDALDYKAAMDAIAVESGLHMQADSRRNLEIAAQRAQGKYKLVPCPACKEPKRKFSWTQKSLKELAESTNLEYLYFIAWIYPTKLSHPTFYGLEDVILSKAPICNTLNAVHALLIENLVTFWKHFGQGAEIPEYVSSSVEGFLKTWTSSKTDFGLPRGTLRFLATDPKTSSGLYEESH
jgi:hypothetical protein